jgi:hypothetical protein
MACCARRLLAIAACLRAKIGGMDRQTLRDWMVRFNEQGADGHQYPFPRGAAQYCGESDDSEQVESGCPDIVTCPKAVYT